VLYKYAVVGKNGSAKKPTINADTISQPGKPVSDSSERTKAPKTSSQSMSADLAEAASIVVEGVRGVVKELVSGAQISNLFSGFNESNALLIKKRDNIMLYQDVEDLKRETSAKRQKILQFDLDEQRKDNSLERELSIIKSYNDEDNKRLAHQNNQRNTEHRQDMDVLNVQAKAQATERDQAK